MSAKENLRKKILEDVLRPLKYDDGRRKKHNILIVDSFSANILSCCFAMHEIFDEGVILIENLEKKREPLKKNDAIYLITSTSESVSRIVSDFEFSRRKLYQAAHIFFVDPCPDDVFQMICKSAAAKSIKTLKEINISFILNEKQSFLTKGMPVSDVATGIACFCANLGFYPVLRYKSDFANSAEICYRVEQKLDEFMKFDKRLGIENDAELIILDRSFDMVSPLLHELTFQSMTHDLLELENENVYTYQTDSGVEKRLCLDESDPLWVELRHKHIAEVIQKICQKIKEERDSSRISSKISKNSSLSIRSIGDTVKRLPSHQKKVDRLSGYSSLAEQLMAKFNQGMNEVCVLEQDMATGFSAEQVPIRDVIIMRRMSCLILPAVPVETRLRLILIYMLCLDNPTTKNEDHYRKILELTDIPEEEYNVVFQVYRKMKRTIDFRSDRKANSEHSTQFATSRFIPRISQVIPNVIDRKLDETSFLYLGKKPKSATNIGEIDSKFAKSARYQSKNYQNDEGATEEKRTIIVYIAGGMTYSEMRVAYELMKKNKNCNIFIGSEKILTPSTYIESFE